MIRTINNTCWMIGTVHVNKTDFRLPESVEKIIPKAERLLVEVLEHDVPPIDVLCSNIPRSERVMKSMRVLCDACGVPMALLPSQDPAVVALLAGFKLLMDKGYKKEYGVEDCLNKRFKEVIGLETGLSQMLALEKAFNLTDEELEKGFLDAVPMIEKIDEIMSGMVKDIIFGNYDEVEKTSSLFMPQKAFDVFVEHRNESMVRSMESYLNKPCLIAVGAAHISGITRILQQKGHHVKW